MKRKAFEKTCRMADERSGKPKNKNDVFDKQETKDETGSEASPVS